MIQPLTILREGVRAVGAVRYAVGVVAIVAVIGVVRALNIDLRIALGGVIILLVLMTVLLLFSRLEGLKGHQLFFWPAAILLWFSLLLFMVIAIFFTSSAFAGWPLDLRYTFGSRRSAVQPKANESSFANTEQLSSSQPRSVTFSMGYYVAEASWTEMSRVVALCLGSEPKACKHLAHLLQGSSIDARESVHQIQKLGKIRGWPSDELEKKVSREIDPDKLATQITTILQADMEAQKPQLEDLSKKLEDLAGMVLIDAKRSDLSEAEMGMLFLGNQIGKIDALLVFGIAAGETEADKVASPCRDWIKAILVAQMRPEFALSSALNPVLKEFPGLTTRVDTLNLAEISAFVGKVKELYLIKTEE